MSNKSKNVGLRIAYKQSANNREAFNHEINLLADINGVLDGHKALTDHKDHVKPSVTESNVGSYGCNINLNFPIRHTGGNQYQYSRLHYVLQELGRVLKEHEGNFQRLESYLDLAGMTEPWVLVAGPEQVLLREGAVQWNALGYEIPGRDSKFFAPINGLTVMGEPTAVDKFRRVWQQIARSHAGSIAKEREAMLRAGVSEGATIDIESMKRQHPNIQWQHLLIWVHTQTEAGGQWYVSNLDEKDQWVLAGVRYVNVNMINMMETPLPFTRGCGDKGLVFLKQMSYATFESQEETVYDGTAPVAENREAEVVA